MVELELNQPTTKKIPAIDPWYGTGIMLKKGCIYRFEVLPPTQTWRDGKMLPPVTADGKNFIHLMGLVPFLRMPSVKWFALLGCINKDKNTSFKIGTFKDYTPDRDGELTCFANDALGFNDYWYRHNNEGEIELTITRIL